MDTVNHYHTPNLSLHPQLTIAQSSLIWALVALLFPPLPVAIRKGFSGHLILNIILLILAWIPAVIHAWYVLWAYDRNGRRKSDRKAQCAMEQERVAVLENEKTAAEMGMGNQQGYYGPTPMAQHAEVTKIEQEIPPQQGQQPPEYARDEKNEILPQPQQQEVPEYARDLKRSDGL